MLKRIQITDLNFPIAWKKLEDHYTNKRRLIAIYTKTLLDLPVVSSDSSSQLQSLLNSTTNAISALEQLKWPINHWNDLLVPIIARKLHFKTLRKWETQVSKSADPPTFSQLSQFITEHIDFLGTTSMPNLSKSKTSDQLALILHLPTSVSFVQTHISLLVATPSKPKPQVSEKSWWKKGSYVLIVLGFIQSVIADQTEDISYVTNNTIRFFTKI